MSKHAGNPAPLSRKLLLLGAAPAIVMFVVLMVFFTSARLEDARHNLAESSQMLAESLAPAVEYAVVSGNTDALEPILTASLNRSQADWIRVTDVLGNELSFVSSDGSRPGNDRYDVFRGEVLQQPLAIGSSREPAWFEPDYGFGSGALRVGTVEVGVSRDQFAARRHDILWTSLAVGIALLLFTLLVINSALSGILGPVQNLSRRVAQLIKGDYQQVSVSRQKTAREIVDLEENLNGLAVHLAKLRDARDETLAHSDQARAKAESANRAKSEFLARMSHELRTPLNGVLGMIELTSDEPLSPRQQEHLNTAKQSAEDLLTVISDILDYSRLDRGMLQLDSRPFDLHPLISNCIASYRHLADQEGIELSLEFLGPWPEPATVVGDPHRTRQVLAGLLDNAIKFSGPGSVRITATWAGLEEGCVVFRCRVMDSGMGIPADRLQNMFETFEQLDSSGARSQGGSGMGLPLIQRLVELMGGHIQVETAPGQGSAFQFEVPFELNTRDGTETVSEEPQQQPGPRATSGSSRRALVVEDNPVNQRVIRAILTRLGFETHASNHGRGALELIHGDHQGYDVILMDCHMPVMDGYETTRHIREWERSKGQGPTPIIALTADAFPETADHCKQAGMNDYLAKPIRKEQLRTALSRWVSI